MLTSKNSTMIDEKKLDEQEAWSFIQCMEDELHRHRLAQESDNRMLQITMDEVTKRFYEYSIIHHQEEILMITRIIYYLNRKWKY